MSSTDYQTIQTIAGYLSQTLQPSTQKPAEETLRGLEGTIPHFALLLLSLSSDTAVSIEAHVRVAAALLFKNLLKRHWPEVAPSVLTLEDRTLIKSQIVSAMLQAPAAIQTQIAEALTTIAAFDFPGEWPSLLEQLLSRLSPNDHNTNLAVLKSVHAIFKRYRHEFRSDELYTEINYVMAQLGPALLQMYTTLEMLLEQAGHSEGNIRLLMNSLLLLNKIYYSLSVQDLPAFFEEHLAEFSSVFLKRFSYTPDKPVLDSGMEEEAGLAEKVPTSIARIVSLYALRYEEDFPQLHQFVSRAWELLASLPTSPKDDKLVAALMKILATVSRLGKHRGIFESVLPLIVEKAIVPNMRLRDSDLELFEDDPIEFIRRDVDGTADEDTRRGSATALARSLMEFYEVPMTENIMVFIDHFLRSYDENPVANWRDKDAAGQLFAAVAVKGSVATHGVTKVNPHLNMTDFFVKHVAADLQPTNAAMHPLLKVDAIKFLYAFRGQLPKEQLAQMFPLLMHHLTSHHYVVHTYAAIAVERILAMRQDGQPMFTGKDLAGVAPLIIENLMRIMLGKRMAVKISENEYLMRTIMRVALVAGHDVLADHLDSIMAQFETMMLEVTRNPSNPRFNHFMFEAIAALLGSCAFNNAAAMQICSTHLLSPFQAVLQLDVAEFVPYVFQLLAAMVEYQPTPSLPAYFAGLLSHVLEPALWSAQGNIPALVRFLQAVLFKDPDIVVKEGRLAAMLSIFQALISSRTNDQHGFALINAAVQYLKPEQIDASLPLVFMVILQRLHAAKSAKFTAGFLTFVSLFIMNYQVERPASRCYALLESIQTGLFGMVWQQIVLPETTKPRDRTLRKVVVAALTSCLCKCPELLANDALWMATLKAILQLLASGPAHAAAADEAADAYVDFAVEDENVEYQASFSRLLVLPAPKRFADDRLPEMNVHLGRSLLELSTSVPGKVPRLIEAAGLEDSQGAALRQALSAARVSILP